MSRISRSLLFFLLVFLVLCFTFPVLYAESLRFNYYTGEKFKILERSDLRRYENGHFVGLSYREVRGVLEVSQRENVGFEASGNFYVFEETKHDKRNVAKKIDQVVPVSFRVTREGLFSSNETMPFPSVQNFPVFPRTQVSKGDVWRAFGVRVVNPLRGERYTRVKFYCEYRYVGDTVKNGREFAVVKARYAVRYRAGEDSKGDRRIKSITGKHSVTIYCDVSGNNESFMVDMMEEHYSVECKTLKSVSFKGFILTWFSNVQLMDRTMLVNEMKAEIKKSGVEDVTVEKRKEGVALTINSIHFVANKAIVLPAERDRLKKLAEMLRKIKGRNFLVVGHTADVGSKESQYVLSVKRAKTIVDYLVSQGISPKRFMYEGKGGTEPVAPNDTEENMAKNRRVEIIVLED